MEDINYFHFLSLPNDILITQLFPKLSLDQIMMLYVSNPSFKGVCLNDELWKIKLFDEDPEYALSKPYDISWKQYYYLLYYSLPLYYRGDRIAYIPFHIRYLDIAINFIEPYILYNNLETLHIVFIDQNQEAKIIVTYPSIKVRIIGESDITRIVLITNRHFDQLPIRNVMRKDQYITREMQRDMSNHSIIVDELTSPLGQLPIYGFIKYDMFDNPPFYIIDNTSLANIYNNHMRQKGKHCDIFSTGQLFYILKTLKVQPPDTDPDLNPDDIEQSDYNDLWITYDNNSLCQIIKTTLETIGHLL